MIYYKKILTDEEQMNTIKITGKKNPLTEEEKKYYKRKLEDRYIIGEQIGVSGNTSSNYLIHHKNGTPFVLKTPNNVEDTRWIDNQISQEKIRSHYLLGYDGKVVFPDMVELGKHYIVEPYCGQPLTAQMFDYSLSQSERKNITEQMGNFLNFLHQQKAKNKIGDIEILSPKSTHSIYDVFNYFIPHLSIQENKEWEKRIETFINRDTSDEFETLTHGDIRMGNVLYNQETKETAVINWDLFNNRSVYRDFVPRSSFGLSYHLLEDIITVYNNAEKDVNIKINLQKLFLFHLLSTYYEIGHTAITNQKNGLDKPQKPIATVLQCHIAPIQHKIKSLYEKENCE